ncbi:hypothetical protein QBC39DRAFT_85011 [Podospora conica]|nr:hypothetical protein QBC39DRAFT_85011 [Schizothecium conicum]
MASSNTRLTGDPDLDRDNLLSIAYRELETTNKQLEEATKEVYRLMYLKFRWFGFRVLDDDRAVQRFNASVARFGTVPAWWADEAWFRQAKRDMDTRHPSSRDMVDRIERAEVAKVELETVQASIRRRIADMTRDQVRRLSILDFPEEILVAIIRYVENSTVDHFGIASYDVKDILSVRQVCRRLTYAASGFGFHRIEVFPNKWSLARLEAVSRHPAIAAEVRHVRLNLRFYNPAFVQLSCFTAYHARRLEGQIRTWNASKKASKKDQLDVTGRAPAIAGILANVVSLFRRLAARHLSFVSGSLSADDKPLLVWLLEVHTKYVRLVKEQEQLMSTGGFARAAGLAMARMPNARNLEIVDTDPPEIALLESGPAFLGDLDCCMLQPMGGRGVAFCYAGGIPSASYRCVVDMLNAVRGGGAWLETLSVILHFPGRDGVMGMAPTLDEHQELASGLQRLKGFNWILQKKMDSGSVGYIEKFLLACIGTPSLESISIFNSGGDDFDAPSPYDVVCAPRLQIGATSIDLVKILGSASRKLVKFVSLGGVNIRLDNLKLVLKQFDAEKGFQLFMRDICLLSGTWKETLDVLRNMEAETVDLRRVRGREVEDMDDEYYDLFHENAYAGGSARCYISKKPGIAQNPDENPFEVVEYERRVQAAEDQWEALINAQGDGEESMDEEEIEEREEEERRNWQPWSMPDEE